MRHIAVGPFALKKALSIKIVVIFGCGTVLKETEEHLRMEFLRSYFLEDFVGSVIKYLGEYFV